MKVYQVYMSYFDGDHDHGYYESPLFATKELAEDFKRRLVEETEKDQDKEWWCCRGMIDETSKDAYVCEYEVLETPVEEIKKSKEYLRITYT